MVGRHRTLVSMVPLAILVAYPIWGLTTAVLNRPADPITGVVPSLESLVTGAQVWSLLGRSILLAICVAIGSVLCGGWLAWVEHRTRVPRWWSLLTLLPLAMPSYLVAATARSALSPGGWIGDALGTPHTTGFGIAVAVLVAITAPLSQLIIGAALNRCSAVEEEAAMTLGASPAKVFKDVTLPRLRPAIGFSALIALLYAISDFGAVAVLDVPVLTWRLYLAVESQNVAKAAVLGAATLVAILPVFLAARWIRSVKMTNGAANRRHVKRGRLQPLQRILTFGVVFGIIGLGAFIPTVTLCLWVADGLSRSLSFVSPWSALGDTVIAALVGALITVALAWLPAMIVTHRQRNKQAVGWIEDCVYVTSALPGVLLALGLMLATLVLTKHLPPGAYGAILGSGFLLMLGYATRFVAEVFAPVRDALASVDVRQVNSARVLGAKSFRRFKTVILPSAAPGIAAAFVIGFNAIVKELPVTLLLGGATGLNTLSFRVWDRYSESLWHDAGLAGLLLVALALASAVLTMRWRQHD